MKSTSEKLEKARFEQAMPDDKLLEEKKNLDGFCCDATMQSRFHRDYLQKTPFSVFS